MRCDLVGCGTAGRAPSADKSGLRDPYEAVSHEACVSVGSRDRPHRVDGREACALEGACARVRNIKSGDRATGSPHEAVSHGACVSFLPLCLMRFKRSLPE
jgi:hypothetical protein